MSVKSSILGAQDEDQSLFLFVFLTEDSKNLALKQVSYSIIFIAVGTSAYLFSEIADIPISLWNRPGVAQVLADACKVWQVHSSSKAI